MLPPIFLTHWPSVSCAAFGNRHNSFSWSRLTADGGLGPAITESCLQPFTKSHKH